MELNNLRTLLTDQLKDIYNAETQLLKALPKMAKHASSVELKTALTEHLEETRGHVERLEEIGRTMDISLKGKKCKAMQGLIEEGNEVLEEEGNEMVLDAALVAAAQRVEHYEISAYGTARAIATRIGEDRVASLLEETREEESAADEKLTTICMESLYPNAPMLDGEEE